MPTLLVATIVALASGIDINAAEVARLAMATAVVKGVQPSVPREVWTRARCVVIIPDVNVSRAEEGRGVMSCRAGEGWSAPVFVRIEATSRIQSSDVVVLVMNESGVQKLLQPKVRLGAEALVAPGPVNSVNGRSAAHTRDVDGDVELLGYSRARGAVAGADLSGVVIDADEDADRHVYGEGATPRTILASRALSAPTQAAPLLAALRGGGSAETATPEPEPPTGGSAKSARIETPNTATSSTGPNAAPPADSDLRTGIVDLQRAIDRLIADATAGENAVATTGGPAAPGTIPVSREHLMQLRREVAALLAIIDKRQ